MESKLYHVVALPNMVSQLPPGAKFPEGPGVRLFNISSSTDKILEIEVGLRDRGNWFITCWKIPYLKLRIEEVDLERVRFSLTEPAADPDEEVPKFIGLYPADGIGSIKGFRITLYGTVEVLLRDWSDVKPEP